MYYFIVNPAAKSGHGMEVWKQLKPTLDEKKVEYRQFSSEKKGDISRLVNEVTTGCEPDADGMYRVVIVGGDGTLNEAVQGVADYSRFIMGYIPAGSANDFAANAGLEKEPHAALYNILECETPARFDLGYMTYDDAEDAGVRHYFTSSCGIGYDAAVSKEAMEAKSKDFLNKLGMGDMIYLLMALKTLVRIKRGDCTITLSGDRVINVKNFLFVISMIYRYEGGGFLFCPDAISDDGEFDICLFGGIPKLKVLAALPASFKGTHYKFKDIEPYRSSTVHIETTMPFYVQLDGEVSTMSSKISICCEKQILRLMK